MCISQKYIGSGSSETWERSKKCKIKNPLTALLIYVAVPYRFATSSWRLSPRIAGSVKAPDLRDDCLTRSAVFHVADGHREISSTAFKFLYNPQDHMLSFKENYYFVFPANYQTIWSLPTKHCHPTRRRKSSVCRKWPEDSHRHLNSVILKWYTLFVLENGVNLSVICYPLFVCCTSLMSEEKKM